MKTRTKKNSCFAAAGIGLITSLCIIIFCSAVVALLIHTAAIKEDSMGYGSLIALLLSAAVGNIVTIKMLNEKKWIGCLLQAGQMYAALIIASMLLFGGPTNGIFTTGLVIIGTSCAVFLLFGKKRSAASNRSRRRHY